MAGRLKIWNAATQTWDYAGWGQQGSKGDTGVQGGQGDTGIHGDTGVQGSTGPGTAVRDIEVTIDNGGVAITTGVKADVKMDMPCSITEWTVLSDVSGSIVIDVWKDTYANFPPTVGDTMVGGGNKPTISASIKGQAAPSGWTTVAIAAGEILRFNVDSVSTITRATIILKCMVG